MEKDTYTLEESKSKLQVDIEEVQKSLKSILGQVKNVEENLGIIKKSIGKNEIILSSVANDIEKMSRKLIELQNSEGDIFCSEDKYTNWNAELIYQKYKEELQSQKKSKSHVIKKETNKPRIFQSFFSYLLFCILIGLLIGFFVTKIFIDKEASLAIPVFLILLIVWRGMVNHFKNFREEDKILATNALKSMLIGNGIHCTENIIDEIYQSSVALEDKESYTIKSIGKWIFAVASSVVLPLITGIMINGILLKLKEGKTVLQFMFTLNDIIPSGLWIADLLLIYYLIFYYLSEAFSHRLNLYKEILKEIKLTLVLKNEEITQL
jgi:hypothetical protein